MSCSSQIPLGERLVKLAVLVIDEQRRPNLHQIPQGHVGDLVAPGRVEFAEAAGALEANQRVVVHAEATVDTQVAELGQVLRHARQALVRELRTVLLGEISKRRVGKRLHTSRRWHVSFNL
jgi:hypothetical protein